METDVSKLKYVDEENNEYIIGALSDYNNERYGMMVNLHNPVDFFIAKIIKNQDNIEFEIVDDDKEVSAILNDLAVIE